MNVKLKPTQKIKILNSADIYTIMQQILLRENKIDRNKEHFWLVCLATNNKILMIELISLGSVNATVVEPMDVFSFALQKRAVKLIMVHNHPSGDLDPSKDDLALTEKMLAIGKFIRVPIIDHLIITEKNYHSFADKGIIAKMEADNHFDLSFKETDKIIKKMETQEKKQKAIRKKEKVDMAKKMIGNKKYSLKEIIELTGLKKNEVEKLKK